MQLIRVLPLYVALLGISHSCAPSAQSSAEPEKAEAILSRAVNAHGMEGLDSTQMQFTFRDREYGIIRRGGTFRYTRSFSDSLGHSIRDVLTNDGLVRYQDDSLVVLTPKDSAAYASSVNSVRYFFQLPYGLSDPAVNAEFLDTQVIDDRVYDRVRVTFEEAGGGTDFEDVYHYFFSQQTGELDYLAYTFEAEEGGIRFRKAINQRTVNGVLGPGLHQFRGRRG